MTKELEEAIDTAGIEVLNGIPIIHSTLPGALLKAARDHLKYLKHTKPLIDELLEDIPNRPNHAVEIYKNPSGQFRDSEGANCNNVFSADKDGDLIVQVRANSIGEGHYYGKLVIWGDKAANIAQKINDGGGL